MHSSPDEIVLNLGIYFRREQSVDELATAVERLERAIKALDRRITRILVEIEAHPRRARDRFIADTA